MDTPNFEQFQEQNAIVPKESSGENPFEMQKYNDVNIPDTPIQYGGSMADSLLNDDEVPDKVRYNNWHIFHKDNTLTFLDEKRKTDKMLAFDLLKIDKLNATPYYEYTFDAELEFNILRNVFETKLDRAMGFKGGNIKNERIMLQSQFSENRQISEGEHGAPIKEGFFKRLLGRR